MEERIEREQGQEQMQISAAEEAPVVLKHMSSELAVRFRRMGGLVRSRSANIGYLA